MIGLLLSEGKDIKSLSSFINWHKICPGTLWESIKKLAKTQDLDEYIRFCNYIQFPIYKNFDRLSQFYTFIMLLRNKFLNKCKMDELITTTRQHLKSVFQNNDAIFDVGYSGRTEELLKDIADITVKSFYIYINDDKFIHRKNLYCFSNATFYNYTPQLFCQLREMLYSDPGQSCVSYDVIDGKIAYVFDTNSIDTSSAICLSIIQNAALDFVSDYYKVFTSSNYSIPYRHEDVSAPLEYFMCYANESDKYIFSTTTFEDEIADGVNINVVNLWTNLQNNKYKSTPMIYLNPENNVDYMRNSISEINDKLRSAQVKIKKLEEVINDRDFELDLRWISISMLKQQLSQYTHDTISTINRENYKDIIRDTNISSPPDFDDAKYILDNPDVRNAVTSGEFKSAFSHYMLYGRCEGRKRQ